MLTVLHIKFYAHISTNRLHDDARRHLHGRKVPIRIWKRLEGHPGQEIGE
jgi:hypothetical protein